MNLLRAMEVVLAVADQTSMSAAARKLGVSLPTIVRVVGEAEQEMGVRLFHRTTRKISLTEDGELCCAHYRRILGDVDNLRRVVAGVRDRPSGQVSMTAPVAFGGRHIAPVLAELVKNYPDLQIRLHLTDRVVDVVDEQIDVAIRIGAMKDSSLIVRKLNEIHQLVCASPALLADGGRPAHPAELSSRPCIQINSNSAGVSWGFQTAEGRFSVPIRGRLTCNAVDPAVNACIAGAGFAYLYSYQAADALRRGALTSVLDEFRLPPVPVNLVFHSTKLLTARMRLVLDEIKKAVAAIDFRPVI